MSSPTSAVCRSVSTYSSLQLTSAPVTSASAQKSALFRSPPSLQRFILLKLDIKPVFAQEVPPQKSSGLIPRKSRNILPGSSRAVASGCASTSPRSSCHHTARHQAKGSTRADTSNDNARKALIRWLPRWMGDLHLSLRAYLLLPFLFQCGPPSWERAFRFKFLLQHVVACLLCEHGIQVGEHTCVPNVSERLRLPQSLVDFLVPRSE